jgi:hypothetical protein
VKEDTVPDKDHGMDAQRYGIFTHELGADLHFMDLRIPD